MTIRKYSFAALLFVAVFVFLPASAIAKDEWRQVKSKNFYVIGNASERDIRNVATKLEQFRETFRQLFKDMTLTAPVPTNVVVFKSDSSYRPFKPKRGDGKIDNNVAGYFQPGDDVNYITLSTEGTDADTYGTIFHEYVHFVINTNYGKSEVPSWFNEGLAEYYQTFEIVDDQKVKLGRPQGVHLDLLAQSKLIPLDQFFTSDARGYVGGHSKSIFYAQSWALIHYLVQTGKSDGLDKFIGALINNRPPEQAFREAFGMGYADMEKELRKYVGQRTYTYHVLTFKNKLTFDTEMQVAPLTESDSNAYLGDLLFHTHRWDDAEPFLRTALTLNPDSSIANTTLGMVKLRQRKYADAKAFLEKATKDVKNHLAFYRYAELLTREGRDEFGHVARFEPATAARIRELLNKAITLNPAFTESYELLAFVNLVNNERLDEALAGLQKALKYQPGNPRYVMRAAEIYLRQKKIKEALGIAEKLAKSSDDDEIRSRAERLSADIRQYEETLAQYEAEKKKYDQTRAAYGPAAGDPVIVRRRPGEEKPTPEQLAKASEEARMRSLNQALRVPESGEKRIAGEITKIECKPKNVLYTVAAENESFRLSSKDFQTLIVTAFIEDGDGEIGCTANLAGLKLVLSYKPVADPKSPTRGELVSIEFVPKTFRFIDLEKEAPPPTYVVEEAGPPVSSGSGGAGTSIPADEDYEAARRQAMMRAIAQSIRKPGAGEKRVLGFIEKSECTNKGAFFFVKTGVQILKVANSNPQAMFMRAYTPDVEGLPIGCGMKNVDIPVVVVYRESTDSKAKIAGDIVSLEFVPKTFQLEQ